MAFVGPGSARRESMKCSADVADALGKDAGMHRAQMAKEAVG